MRLAPRANRRVRTAISLAFLSLVVARAVYALSLEPATVQAWEEYVKFATIQMEHRLRPGGSYLWIDEAPDRLVKVKAGEILVSPVSAQNPKRVPSGLIHDWIGAVFIPNITLDQVLRVGRDYSRYKDLYQPALVDFKLVSADEKRDRCSIVLMNKSFFRKTALRTEYESDHFRLDSHRAYNISRSIRVNEIEQYGSPEEHMVTEGQGRGLVWRLMSISRYLERDGGVYLEVEAIALSRDIPGSVRWIVEPVVRNVSRQALRTSLQQTERGVRLSAVEVADRH